MFTFRLLGGQFPTEDLDKVLVFTRTGKTPTQMRLPALSGQYLCDMLVPCASFLLYECSWALWRRLAGAGWMKVEGGSQRWCPLPVPSWSWCFQGQKSTWHSTTFSDVHGLAFWPFHFQYGALPTPLGGGSMTPQAAHCLGTPFPKYLPYPAYQAQRTSGPEQILQSYSILEINKTISILKSLRTSQ